MLKLTFLPVACAALKTVCQAVGRSSTRDGGVLRLALIGLTLGLDKEGKPVPAGRGKRENLCIKLSRDDGKTWPMNKTLDPGKAAYSDLAVLPDGTVICLYEADTSIDCARFNLDWVTAP